MEVCNLGMEWQGFRRPIVAESNAVMVNVASEQ